MSGSLAPDLLAILVCPLTRTPLRWDAAAGELVSDAAGLAYPVREGVPIMVPERARRLVDGAQGPTFGMADHGREPSA